MIRLAACLAILTPLLDARNDDWLLYEGTWEAEFGEGERPDERVLTNGLLRRTFRFDDCVSTVDYVMEATGEQLVRAVRPELTLTIDGVEYAVGGLEGQPNQGYLEPSWIDDMTPIPGPFDRLLYMETVELTAPFPWERARYAERRPWPAPGVEVRFHYYASEGPLENCRLTIVYQMFDGLPCLAKWFEFQNAGDRARTLEAFTSDILAAPEPESDVDQRDVWRTPNLHVETDYTFGGFTPHSSNQTVRWVPDPQHRSQVNWRRETPNLLVVGPEVGPAVTLAPGESFESIRTYHLAYDSTDRERQGLSLRRMYRTIAPWVTENPLMMHVRSADPDTVRNAIDQCAEVGFEMVILTFGSGFDIEDDSPENLTRWRELADYAHERGVELGGYSLLSSRRVSDAHDVIDLETGEPGGAKFGNAPCLGSAWGQEYFAKLYAFFEATGFDLLEHDGSYPGDFCASTEHPGHAGHADSQWRQHETIRDFYRWCRRRGIYLNVPDWYLLNGSNKIGMGYREVNWSLPREQQLVLGRQNIYDGTWTKTPSMGWMFVPLVEYHGGGPAATLEPLVDHLDDYERHLWNNLGAGVQACWRGPRLYDAPETKAVVERWVRWYLEHRAILDSDVVHVRRADGRRIDALLHVNPLLEERGMLVAYNPRDEPLTETFELDLYYTGLTERAVVVDADGTETEVALDGTGRAAIDVSVAARGFTWLVFRAP